MELEMRQTAGFKSIRHAYKATQGACLASLARKAARDEERNAPPVRQCRYQDPRTAVRCTEEPDGFFAYCAKHR
jgi:hypothetical protein